jgi:hypothetical protein
VAVHGKLAAQQRQLADTQAELGSLAFQASRGIGTDRKRGQDLSIRSGSATREGGMHMVMSCVSSWLRNTPPLLHAASSLRRT